jgi:hypothetical protein
MPSDISIRLSIIIIDSDDGGVLSTQGSEEEKRDYYK